MKKCISFLAGDGGNFHFLDPLIGYLSDYFDIRVYGNPYYDQWELQTILNDSDLVWFEWGNGPVIKGSRLPAKAKKICRIHRYELFSEEIRNIAWNNIDRLIFINEEMSALFRETLNYNSAKNQIRILPNPVPDTGMYRERKPGFDIAYTSRFNSDKNPSLMLYILKKLVDINPLYKVHMVGRIQDRQLYLYCMHLIKEMKLENNFHYYGQLDNIEEWLADKDYLLSTSIVESQSVAVSEAMLAGIKPVIHNSFGRLDKVFDRKYIFNTVDEAVTIITDREYNSGEYRELVRSRYSEQVLFPKLLNIISELVNEPEKKIAVRSIEKEPKISIGIMTYNRAHFLKAAVESALKQEGEYEIVIVDDASSDETEKIVNELSDGRIRYFRNETNQGRPKVRNRIIKEAFGDYILWMGDDDILMPGTVRDYSEIIKLYPDIDVVYGNIQAFDNETGQNLELYSAHDYTGGGQNILLNLIKGSGLTDGGSMIRRSLYEQYGGYNEEYLRAQDNELWSRLAANVKYYKFDRIVYRYRKHEHNVSFGEFVDTSYESKTIRNILKTNKLETIFSELDLSSKKERNSAFKIAAKGLFHFRDCYNAVGILKDNQAVDDYDSLAEYTKYLLTAGELDQAKKDIEYYANELGINRDKIYKLNVLINEFEKFRTETDICFRNSDFDQVKKILAAFHRKYGITFDIAKLMANIYLHIQEYSPAYNYLAHCVRFQPENNEIVQTAFETAKMIKKVKELEGVISRIMEKNNGISESTPSVSVIIPTYNRPGQLIRAVDSVLNQTFKDFEIIVVNDAGKDVSDLLNEKHDSRIRYLCHEKNGGLPAARNTGIRAAKGRYIAYLDDDDVYYPEHLETLTEHIRINKVPIAYSDACRVWVKDGKETNSKRDVPYSEEFDNNKILVTNFIPVLCVMHEKSCLLADDGFDERLRVFEDWDLWIRLSRKYKFSHIKKVTCEFSWNDDGSTMTSSKWIEFCWTTLLLYNKYRKYASDSQHFENIVFDYVKYHENSLYEIANGKWNANGLPNADQSMSEMSVIFHELGRYYYLSGRLDDALISIIRNLESGFPYLDDFKFLLEISEKINTDKSAEVTSLAKKLNGNSSRRKEHTEDDIKCLIDLIYTILEERVDEKIHNLSDRAGKNTKHQEDHESRTLYDIILPVYNAYEKLSICLESLVKYTAPVHSIVLLNDASTDLRISGLLNEYAEKHSNISVINNKTNLGFVKNVNQGFRLSDRNVVLLNSDIHLTPFWLEKMDRCLNSRTSIGIVSPLSNNATLLSVPNPNCDNKGLESAGIEKVAKIVDQFSKRQYPSIPTAVGFCMIISRDTIRKIGEFDEAFGLGYGEENDFCMRAHHAGIESVCCDDVYVHHYGESSFSSVSRISERKSKNMELLLKKWPNYNEAVFTFCMLNPLRYIQETIRREISEIKEKSRPRILNVLHNFGSLGGTEQHTKFIMEQLGKEYDFSVIYPETDYSSWTDLKSVIETDSMKVFSYNNIPRELNSRKGAYVIFSEDIQNVFAERFFSRFIEGGGYDIVHFHHLGNWGSFLLPLIAKSRGAKVILSIHDYFLWCPEYNLLNENHAKCNKTKAGQNDPECIRCLSKKRIMDDSKLSVNLQKYILERNILAFKVLNSADKIIVPSLFVKEKIRSSFGSEIADKTEVVPHGINKTQVTVKRTIKSRSRNLHAAFLGNMYDRKGALTFIETVRLLAGENVEFSVFGYVPDSYRMVLKELKVNIHGQYLPEELPSLLASVDLIVIPSIWDETYCLTADEAINLGVPVVAAEVGAIQERITDGKNGFLFRPNDSGDLTNKIKSISKNKALLKNVKSSLNKVSIKSIEQNSEDYNRIYQEVLNSPSMKTETEYMNKNGKVSIIILTYNGIKYTKECVSSILQYTDYPYELIIIDNLSTDGTREYLNELHSTHPHIKIILNSENMGFPKGINQGFLNASGKYILVANNDIIVTDGWLKTMVETAESDPKIGIVGPVSNNVSGVQFDKEAKYSSVSEMHAYSVQRKSKSKGEIFRFPRIVFLCTLIKREVIDAIGGLDERFSPGNYEDDDFCLRSQLLGYDAAFTREVFIHHYGSASFSAEGQNKHDELREKNARLFAEKWGGSPDEIWLRNKTVKVRNIRYPISADIFSQSFERALIHMEDNEIAPALDELLQAKKYFEASDRKNFEKISYSDILDLIGNSYLILGDLEQSKEYFEEELRLATDSFSACYGLGQVFYLAGNYETAAVMLEWAVKINPDNENAANLLKEAGLRIPIAKSEDNKTFSDDDSDSDDRASLNNSGFLSDYSKASVLINEAENLMSEQRWKEAEEILNLILSEDPANISALNNLAVIEIMKCNLNAAEKYIRKVFEVQPNNPMAAENMKYLEELLRNNSYNS